MRRQSACRLRPKPAAARCTCAEQGISDLERGDHTLDKVNTWNNNVVHFADLVISDTVAQGALLPAGFSPEAVLAATTFSLVMSFVDHVNAYVRLGILNYVIGGFTWGSGPSCPGPVSPTIGLSGAS